jgi:Thioredoxin
MPRPPLLPTIDWRELNSQGSCFEEWLDAAEMPEHAAKMRVAVDRQHLEPMTRSVLAHLSRDVHVIAFAEDWCGDVVRHVPVLQAMQSIAPRLRVRYLSREQAPDAFVRFLTNGGEAVPKFIFLSADWVECGNWGPMPDADRLVIARGKACNNVKAARELVAASYASDKSRQRVVEELLDRIIVCAAEQP